MRNFVSLCVAAAALLFVGCDKTTTCGPGTRLDGGECVPLSTLVCGPGTQDVNGTCAPVSTTTCGANTRLEGGACVPTFGCPTGTHLEGEACVLDAVPSTWSANLRISPEGLHASDPSLAADADGHVFATFSTLSGQTPRVVLYGSSDFGATWAKVKEFAPTDLFVASPSIAATPDGKFYLVWTDYHSGQQLYPADILFTSSADHGATWSAPKKLNVDDGTANNDLAQVSVDTDGAVHVHYFTQPAPYDYRASYTRSNDGGATFSTPELLPAGPGSGNDIVYAMKETPGAATSSGDWVIPETVTAYYAGTANVGFLRRAAGGSTWERVEVDGLFNSREAPVNGRPVFASSSTGRNCFAYVDAPNRDYGIYAATAQGNLSFGKAARIDEGAGSMQVTPALAADPEGQCHLVWFDNRSGAWEIWGATLRADGTRSKNERVSDASFTENGTYQQSIGSTLALTVAGTTRYAAWTDTRDGLSAVYFASSPLNGP